ncbi:MAG: UvrB/UvrC motif-containing protein, partial [Desulfobacterales bacterium]|nr:UvrB/UvrC motif-containing protein [Desulfobacterales bacterium]
DYNERHGITPASVRKDVVSVFEALSKPSEAPNDAVHEPVMTYETADALERQLNVLEKEMRRAAQDLEFERAAEIRDRIKKLRTNLVFEGQID